MPDPASFFREDFVLLFNRGVALLEERAGRRPRARQILDDVRGARGLCRLSFEGGEELWLRVKDGEMSAPPERPAGLPVRVAVALPEDAAALWVAQLRDEVDLASEEAAVRAARTASRRVEEALEGDPLEFHLVIRETPDFEQVVVRVGRAAHAPPEQPRFTVTVSWDDLASLREPGRGPQQLLMQGRLKLGGDYSRAMQVAMQLMQRPG